MHSKLVSVLIVTRNRRGDLLRSLESIRSQTYKPLEIVVLDNGSTDDTIAAIEEAFPEVRLLKMPKNYGDWEGRDIALRNCSGEYLFSFDDDAVTEPDAISSLINIMECNPLLAVIQPKVIDPESGEAYAVGFDSDWKERTHYKANFLGGAALYRMTCLRQVGGFPHYLLGGAEHHLSLRFLDEGYRILYYPEVNIYHYLSRANRIPRQRLFLSSLQRIKATFSHYPGIIRPAFELIIKIYSYSSISVQQGYYLRLPLEISSFIVAAMHARLVRRWRVKQSTINLLDYLTIHPVETVEEYDAVPIQQNMLSKRVLARLILNSSGEIPAPKK